MSDENTKLEGQLNWDEFEDFEEEFNEEDLARSEDISFKMFIGRALCRIKNPTPIEKDFGNGAFVAINLDFEVLDVHELELPVMNDGKVVMRNNKDGIKEPVLKVRVLNEKEKAAANEKFKGMIAGSNEIFMFKSGEKQGTKDRRLNVAQKIGLIDKSATRLTTGMWKKADGLEAIVEFARNKWVDKRAGSETKGQMLEKGNKVPFSGYESANPTTPEDAAGDDDAFDDI